MTTAREALLAMGIDPDEAIATDERLRSKPRRDSRICICGHAISRHNIDEDSGRSTCSPSQMSCSCLHINPVLEADDTRMFLRKTTGPGKEHALIRGISALIAIDKSCTWIAGSQLCQKCGTAELPIVPVPVKDPEMSKVVYRQSQHNAMMCAKCLGEIS
jgi:hypothetical protein